MNQGGEEERLARWAKEDLPLFGVVGLRRLRGGSHSGTGTMVGGQTRTIVTSQSVTFVADDDAHISVTSHRGDDDEKYGSIRSWAPINPYLATRRGQVAAAAWERQGLQGPEDLEWSGITIVVDGKERRFEIAELGEGVVAAVGRVPGAIISIDSRGVPVRTVQLERLTDSYIPPPPRPDLGENGEAVLDALDRRFELMPFHRIRRSADHWALLDVEEEHLARLARDYHLSGKDAETLTRYWNERIEAELAPTLDRLDDQHPLRMYQSPMARRLGRGFLFQLWFNTFGLGARTWFGNRYAGIRHHTFRIRWRP